MSANRKVKRPLTCVFVATCILFIMDMDGKADFTVGVAEVLGPPINSTDPSDYEWGPRIHLDGLSITIYRNYDDENERWVYTRPTKQDPWDAGIRMDTLPRELRKGGNIMPGWTTLDGLELYTSSNLSGHGSDDIFVRTRGVVDDVFSGPVSIGPLVNTQNSEAMPSVSPDGLELYFSDYGRPRPGGRGGEDLWVARRATRNDPWQEPENLGAKVNSPSDDSRVHISADGLLLFFDSNRSGGCGGWDIYVTRRKSLSDPWQEPVNLGPGVNSPTDESSPNISSDGREFFFVRNKDIWRAPINALGDVLEFRKPVDSAIASRASVNPEEAALFTDN
jgi:hypothetical protein